MKKAALKGLIILGVVVALCMFFANTVQTITTPKVKIVTPTYGKLEQSIDLTGSVVFPKETEVFIEGAEEMNIKLIKSYVKVGSYIKKGDRLFTMEVSDYDTKMKELRKTYDDKTAELDALDTENYKRNRRTDRNDAYQKMIKEQEKFAQKKADTALKAVELGLALSSDVDMWPKETAAFGNEELSKLARETAEAKLAKYTAEQEYITVLGTKSMKISDELFKYVNDRTALEEEIATTLKDMMALESKASSLGTIYSGLEGYVTEISLEAATAYDGSTYAYKISSSDEAPYIRADVTELSGKSFSNGTRVNISASDGGTYRTKITGTTMDSNGQKYILVALTEDIIKSEGGMSKIMNASLGMSVSYKAAQSSTLIAASAVRSDGEDKNYVFVINARTNGFFGKQMYVTKTDVTVLERSDTLVSIQEDMSYSQLADKEDRALENNKTVMEYIN
ncbi:MAG: efflux RND transporter periplasmic adaptor subunit [Eubacteriales bacterium]|nr:efflux RND transporter periplasmic adaptor subunit [Eubacteriales bacterium]MDD3880866.1 efflux RND transporter periplasmic adaptor subunit [Eubacteriales bacterium]MDD4511767.1 efflux RND transporter periplasmic adaptor subunit [Eubacteriales bacterium]